MCSLNADADSDDDVCRAIGESSPEDAGGGGGGGGCRKCGCDEATVTLRLRDRYCAPCFVTGLTHKFRANFGREKTLRGETKALLAHAGDANCSALLRLVSDALVCSGGSSHKRLRLTPHVVHIDEGDLRRDSAERRRVVESCGCAVSIVPLREALPADERDGLREIVDSFRDSTARRDFLKTLRRRLLLRIARERDCSFALSADVSSDLAADTLINVSLGGGAHIRCDVGFVDDRDEIKILRPMRDFTSEELDQFVRINKIDCPKSTPQSDRFADLQSRIESFVSELQCDFPATVSTVLRTGGKLETETTVDPDLKCVLCLSNLETSSDECSAVRAVRYSEKVSQKCENESACCGGCRRPPRERNLREFFCYRCNSAGAASVPPSMLSVARSRRSRADAMEAIGDFLL